MFCGRVYCDGAFSRQHAGPAPARVRSVVDPVVRRVGAGKQRRHLGGPGLSADRIPIATLRRTRGEPISQTRSQPSVVSSASSVCDRLRGEGVVRSFGVVGVLLTGTRRCALDQGSLIGTAPTSQRTCEPCRSSVAVGEVDSNALEPSARASSPGRAGPAGLSVRGPFSCTPSRGWRVRWRAAWLARSAGLRSVHAGVGAEGDLRGCDNDP